MFTQTLSVEARAELARIAAFVRDRDDAWAVPPESGAFLHQLVLSGGFHRGLEIGTSYGYSGLWLGAALLHNGGALTTLEHSPEKVRLARELFHRAGFGDAVQVVQGGAAESLARCDGPFDFVFIDADKESSQRYFDLFWPKLAHRATIVTDNVRSHEQALAGFVANLRRHPALCSTLVAIGSGLEVTVKVAPHVRTASVDGADWVI